MNKLTNLFNYSEILSLAINKAEKYLSKSIGINNNFQLELKKYIANSVPYNYIHMSDDDHYKGVNINTRFNTPLGVYAYPLTSEIYEQVINNKLPFAGDRQYIHVFKATGNILYTDRYTTKNLNEDIIKLKIMFPKRIPFKDGIHSNINTPKINSQAGTLFYYVFKLSMNENPDNPQYRQQNPLKAYSIFTKLGYDGICDFDSGVIHNNEPTQAVIFNSKNIKYLDIIKNDRSLIYESDDSLSVTKMICKLIGHNDFENNINSIKEVYEHLIRIGNYNEQSIINVVKKQTYNINKLKNKIIKIKKDLIKYKEIYDKESDIGDIKNYIELKKKYTSLENIYEIKIKALNKIKSMFPKGFFTEQTNDGIYLDGDNQFFM